MSFFWYFLKFQNLFLFYFLDATYGWDTGDKIELYYSHQKNKYETNDPIVLSDKSIPVIELRTLETEYLGTVS